MLNHPFIIDHIITIQDENYIYFVSEYVAGIELFYVIQDLDILSKKQSQFYISQLILCM
jgi:cGMP-dependent protein kinase